MSTVESCIKQYTELASPLHGIPLLVKDSIVTKDEMEASAGSFVLKGAKPADEATTVARLRAAGAIILGKTNLGEWGNFRDFMTIPNGWSPRGGQTTSSYLTGGDPGGSSAGSAVAASLGLCMAALGAEVCEYTNP